MLGGSLLSGSSGATGGLSREFFDLVKNIGESRSKQDEDRIMLQEIATLKVRMVDPTVTKMKMKEYLARALYVEMLGHDASFAHIHAVKLASDKNILCKRTGYMLCGLCLRPQDELMLLLVNTVQKDLASSDFLEVAAALNSCSQVIHQEAIPVLLPSVVNLLAHPKEMIRRKALSALLTLYKADPANLPEMTSHLKLAIHDSDPGVTSAALDLVHEIASRRKVQPEAEAFLRGFDGLVPTLVSILRDIVNHKLPRDWDFHRVPAPWLQMKIMNVITLVVEKDQALSEEVYEVLRTVITRCELQANVSYAVMYECIKTITSIYPLPALLEVAANCVSRFIEADTRNLQHAGLTGLSYLVEIDPTYVTKHQLAIIDCLDDRDETVRSRALDLLAKTTTVSNVTAVVDKLLASADLYGETESKRQLIQRAVELTDRWSPNHEWYISTLTRLFLKFSDYVPLSISHDLIRLVRDGPTDDKATNDDFRRMAVAKMLEVANHVATVTDNALLAAFWIIGAYGYRLRPEEYSAEDILDTLIDVVTLDRPFTLRDLRSCLVTALLKHSAHMIDDLIWKSEASAEKKLAMVEGADGTPSWLFELHNTLHTLALGGEASRDWDFDISQKIAEFKVAIRSEKGLRALYLTEGSSEAKATLKSDTVKTCIEALMLSKQVIPATTKPKPAVSATIASSTESLPRKRPAPLQYRPYVDEAPTSQPVTTPRSERGRRQETQTSATPAESAHPPGGSGSSEEFKLARGGPSRWKLDGYVIPTETQHGSRPTPEDVSSSSGARRPGVTSGAVKAKPPFPARGGSIGRVPVVGMDTHQQVRDGRLEEKKRVATALFAGVTTGGGGAPPLTTEPIAPSRISPRLLESRPRPTTVPPAASAHTTFDLLDLEESVSSSNEGFSKVTEGTRKKGGGGHGAEKAALIEVEGGDLHPPEDDALLVSTAGSLPLEKSRAESAEKVSSHGGGLRYRPLRISVEQIAGTWQSLPNETKGHLPASGGFTAETVLGFFSEEPYYFHMVQAIGHEGLAAAEVADGLSAGKRIYMYCWVDATQHSTQLTLRSDLSQEVIEEYLPTLLQDLSELV